jgi:uncharacterized paraquat-inducible protein A
MIKQSQKCSICETKYAVIHNEEEEFIYCPFCGEDITNEENELDMGIEYDE